MPLVCSGGRTAVGGAAVGAARGHFKDRLQVLHALRVVQVRRDLGAEIDELALQLLVPRVGDQLPVERGEHHLMRLHFATDVCLLESITRQLRELGTVVLSLCRATSGRLLRRGGEGRELPVEGDVVHIHALRELPHGSRRELPLDGVGGPLLGPVEVQDLLDDLGVIELPGRRSAWVRPGLPGRPE